MKGTNTSNKDFYRVKIQPFYVVLLCLMVLPGRAQEAYFDQEYNLDYEKMMVDRMKQGIDSFLTDYTEKVIQERGRRWNYDFSSSQAYEASILPQRQQLRQIIGAVDDRHSPNMRIISQPGGSQHLAETSKGFIYQVQWDVMGGLESEGLLLTPKGEIAASVVLIPDADQNPESYAGLASGEPLGLRLMEKGAQVIIPTLVNRKTTYSGGDAFIPYNNFWDKGTDSVSVWTNHTHREWIHRQGYIMGRHIIGLEVQKILAAVDWFESQNPEIPIGVLGYAEGGLLAFYSAALDPRIETTWVSGYFNDRKDLWKEPVYRNVWGLLKHFGDAEIASLITPRQLIIEASDVPAVQEPVPAEEGRRDFGFPGRIETPAISEVQSEVVRYKGFYPAEGAVQARVILASKTPEFGGAESLNHFSTSLHLKQVQEKPHLPTGGQAAERPIERHRRVFDNMVEFIQDMIPTADRTRNAFFEGDLSSPEAWHQDMQTYRKLFYEDLIGKIGTPLMPVNPKIREIYDEPGWKGYEVVLEVWPGVAAWGILAVPKDIKPEDKRPTVVLQHGIGGRPTTPIDVKSYKRVLPALVNRGFVVFSPHNPYQFNIRKANAVGTSAFSVIIPQHQQILNFLESLDYVDESRIAFYGKSWGGRSAQRIPVIEDRYSVVISSAYFNDWLLKAVSTNYRNSYFFERSLGIYEWNQGNTFGHAEMAAMIAPRPFMVENGRFDGVAADPSVAYEYAKVHRLYHFLGIEDRTDLEFFLGGHDINGKGTFEFLHNHLNWPAPEEPDRNQLLLGD